MAIGSTKTKRGAVFREWTSPSTGHITNDYLRYLLENNFVPIVGFSWVEPTASPRWDGWVALLKAIGTHKVVISGFRDHAFPLRVNDVGDGTVKWVRLTKSVGNRPLGHAQARGQAVALVDWGSLQGRTLIEFEALLTRPGFRS